MTTQRTLELARQFEQLIGELYEAEGYEILKAQSPGPDPSFDFVLMSPGEETVGVEVKLYRTATISAGRLNEMVQQAAGMNKNRAVHRIFLVLGSSVGGRFSDDLGTMEIVDQPRLLEMAAKHPSLLPKFEALFREVAPPLTDAAKVSQILTPEFIEIIQATMRRAAGQAINALKPRPGHALIQALRAVPPGRKSAAQFEKKVFDALKYVFEDDLTAWSEQLVSRNGLSRYDVIARISSEHDFWRGIIAFFRSWYVVFEFKNYGGKITQGEILTTEKYLYAGAMRTVAFIISTKGASPNAMETARGALREHGKLMVNLTVDEVCQLVEAKDKSNDPNAILYDLVDDMLMKIER